MKKIILLLMFGLALTRCAMDETPLERQSPEMAFRDSTRAEMFVNELYIYLNAGWAYNQITAMLDCVSDLAVYSPLGGCNEALLFTRGTLNSAVGGSPDARWAEVYTPIRKCNIVLQNLHYIQKISESRRTRFRGEATLMKAVLHYELIKRYGGIPIVDDILDMNGEIHLPRNTFEECVEYVCRLCDEAAEMLPVTYASNEFGRLTRGAALGMKAKMLLLAASPLFNENPVDGSTDVHRYAAADRNRWKRAAEAALEVIELKNPDGSKTYQLYPDYQRFFFTREGNREGIIMRQAEGLSIRIEGYNGPIGYQGARGLTNATAELVDMYELRSGKLPADDPEYNPQRPYENRCDRFYGSVLYSGAELWGRETEFFEEGKDYPAQQGAGGCITGYTMFKHVDPLTSLVAPIRNTYHDWPVLRYAEILLIYAECMNEASGMDDNEPVTDERIYTFLNELRARVSLPPVSGLTRGEMRTLVRRERTVEMAFEDTRYQDLRRWREAETVLNRPVHGIRVTKEDNRVIYGERQEVEARTFHMRNYYYPIPQSELDKNKALVKNPGW